MAELPKSQKMIQNEMLRGTELPLKQPGTSSYDSLWREVVRVLETESDSSCKLPNSSLVVFKVEYSAAG